MQIDTDHSNSSSKKQLQTAFSTRDLSSGQNGLSRESKRRAESFKAMETGAASAASTAPPDTHALLPIQEDPPPRPGTTDSIQPIDDAITIEVQEVQGTRLIPKQRDAIAQGLKSALPDAPAAGDDKFLATLSSLETKAGCDLQPEHEIPVDPSPIVADTVLVQSSTLGESRGRKFTSNSIDAQAEFESLKICKPPGSLGQALCSNGCEADDAVATHWSSVFCLCVCLFWFCLYKQSILVCLYKQNVQVDRGIFACSLHV